MQVLLPPPPPSSTHPHNKPTSRPPSRRPSFASSYTSDGSYMDYEDYTIVSQDLANVHFHFEEEEEYLTDYSMDEENPFHTPTQESFMDGIKDPHYCSPTHSVSPTSGAQHKLKRSFGMDNISPLYFNTKNYL